LDRLYWTVLLDRRVRSRHQLTTLLVRRLLAMRQVLLLLLLELLLLELRRSFVVLLFHFMRPTLTR
jgi:cell division protein FtsL